MSLIPALERQKQVDLFEYEASLKLEFQASQTLTRPTRIKPNKNLSTSFYIVSIVLSVGNDL